METSAVIDAVQAAVHPFYIIGGSILIGLAGTWAMVQLFFLFHPAGRFYSVTKSFTEHEKIKPYSDKIRGYLS